MGLREFFSAFLNLIYKQKCLVCSCAKQDNFLCKTCAKDVDYLSSFPHKIYNNIPIYSACLYKSTVKKLIHKLKFCHIKNASIPLSEILYKYFQKIDKNENYTIVYINSFIFKNFQRGYMPLFEIVKNFSELTGLKYQKNFILKIKYTKPQYKVNSIKNKRKNIKGSFKINPKYIEKLKNENLLLIDDITTSGATIEEVIDCLINEGFKKIICLTISKAV